MAGSVLTRARGDLIALWPVLVLFLSLIFVRHEFAIFALAVLAITYILVNSRHKDEVRLFALGVVIGFLFEFIGDKLYKLQYWESSSLFGVMPLWLPVFWGITFILVHRISRVVVRD